MFSSTTQARSTRLLAVILAVLLAVTMLPAAGLASAYADEPAARPATTGGDVTLEGATEAASVAQQREDGMYVADSLVYTVADGGLALVGFDGLPQGEDAATELAVPAKVSVNGQDMDVVGVSIVEGNVAESVTALTLPYTIQSVDTATLASAFPNLATVEVASPAHSAVPVAAGAAALRAAYSSFGGLLFKNAVSAPDDGETISFDKELVWAPPATVAARIPAECTSIASGAFADCANLKTVVCFGVMNDIAAAQKAEDGTITPGAFTDEQIQTVNVIVPQTGTVVPDGDRVSADVAVTDHSTMDIKRESWWKSGFASDRITLGEVYGSTTNTLPVSEEGTLEVAEAEVAYAPETTQNSSSRKAGIEPPESAIPTPVPDDDQLDSSESGLVFTHLADMTLSMSWKGDPTATPAQLNVPAYATINGVTYPVTEIAPRAFEGAVFLTSVTIPEGVTTIGDSAFAGCSNLADAQLPATLKSVAADAFDGTRVIAPLLPVGASGQTGVFPANVSLDSSQSGAASSDAAPLVPDGASGVVAASPNPIESFVSVFNGQSSIEDEGAPLGDEELISSAERSTISPFASTPSTSSGFSVFWVYTRLITASGVESVYNVFKSPVYSKNIANFDIRTSAVKVTLSISCNRIVLGYDDTGNVYIGGDTDGYNDSATVIFNLKNGLKVDSAVWSADGFILYVSQLTSAAVAWDSITGKPTSFTPSSHNHTMANITDLKKYGKSDNVAWADVSGKPTLGTLASKNSLSWSEVTGKPSTFTPSSHTHAIADITNLQTTLNDKANASHTHTIANVTGLQSALDGKAAANHTHDDRYYTEGEIDGKVSLLTGSVDEEAAAREAADDAIRGDVAAKDAATNARVDAVEASFGEIAYAGMEEAADAGVYPTSYRAGGMPSLHEPAREGWDFAGWTWARTVRAGHAGDVAGSAEGATTDAAALAEAFAEPGLVTLKATWAQEAPKGTYFFTERDPLAKAGPAPQEHVIKVVLTRTRSYPVDRVEFSWDNWTGLIAEGASVTLTVGTEYDEETGEIKGGKSCTLARDAAGANRAAIEGLNMVPVQFASRQCGLYVGISVPDGAVDKVVESYTEGSYVDSLVKMSYKLAG